MRDSHVGSCFSKGRFSRLGNPRACDDVEVMTSEVELLQPWGVLGQVLKRCAGHEGICQIQLLKIGKREGQWVRWRILVIEIRGRELMGEEEVVVDEFTPMEVEDD